MDKRYQTVCSACSRNTGMTGTNGTGVTNVTNGGTPGMDAGTRYNCLALLEKIRQLDFAILDATLYLDVYPECNEAIEYIAAKNAERSELIARYEPTCGPLTMHGITSGINTAPWPWQYCGS